MGRCKSMRRKSARLSPSPSASVDLPHLSRRPAGVCAFCRISLEPEAEGDYPTASVRSSWGRRVRERSSIYSGSSTLERTSPGKRYPKDAAIQSTDDPRWGGRPATFRGHPSKVVTSTGTPTRQNLGYHGFVKTPSRPKHFPHHHFAGARAGMPGGPPLSRR